LSGKKSPKLGGGGEDHFDKLERTKEKGGGCLTAGKGQEKRRRAWGGGSSRKRPLWGRDLFLKKGLQKKGGDTEKGRDPLRQAQKGFQQSLAQNYLAKKKTEVGQTNWTMQREQPHEGGGTLLPDWGGHRKKTGTIQMGGWEKNGC